MNFPLERRIIYDYETFGDSPTCLSQSENIGGLKALVQGFGVTEANKLPDCLLETNVTTLTNEECRQWIHNNVTYSKKSAQIKPQMTKSFPQGINDIILCSVGIQNEKTKCYSVSLSWVTTFLPD